ncbi:MAG: SGNH/GDSL hydrolase family protein [Phycisphaerae bacterium]
MSTPKIFVIGDSISLQYGPHLAQMIAGRYEYGRKTGREEALKDLDLPVGANGGDSDRVLAYVQALRDGGDWKPDLALINCGLHDIKLPADGGGDRQVPLDRYRTNLRTIVGMLGELGIGMVWIRTTPADEEVHDRHEKSFRRLAADVDAYNRAADEIMETAGVPAIDLFAFTRSLGGQEIFDDHVHFPEPIQKLQAAFIAGWLDRHFGG